MKMKKITETLFNIGIPSPIRPHEGCILLSSPFLLEEGFTHSVGLIIDYDAAEGATGAIMNNVSACRLSEVVNGVDQARDIRVFNGGPLGKDRLYFIHTLGNDIINGAREFAPGLYVGGEFDDVIDYINAGYCVDEAVRFFIGYCCWGKSQLEEEISDGIWATGTAPSKPGILLSGSGDRYWHRTVRMFGNAYRSWNILPRHAEFN